MTQDAPLLAWQIWFVSGRVPCLANTEADMTARVLTSETIFDIQYRVEAKNDWRMKTDWLVDGPELVIVQSYDDKL